MPTAKQNGARAADVMSRDVITVTEDMDLRELTRMFLDQGITGAPVLDRQGNLAGVISQHDLLYYSLGRGDELVYQTDFYDAVRVEGRRLPSGFQIEDANSGCVSDVMTPLVTNRRVTRLPRRSRPASARIRQGITIRLRTWTP